MNWIVSYHFCVVIILSTLAGCTVGPRYQRPAMPLQTSFDQNPDLAQAVPSNVQWWSGFADPLLDHLVQRASTNNYDLKLAQARLREARALWTEARFDFAPTVRNENVYEMSRLSKDAANNRSRNNELYRAGFDATWELDLWGKVRRNVEAARATVEAVEASRDDILISVQAELAANYIQLRGIQAQLEVARRNATNQAQTLQLAETLRDGGQGTQLDVARAKSLLSTTLASLPPLEASAQAAIHRLSVLCALSPIALARELSLPAPIPVTPDSLSLDNPTELLKLRPDIRAAERTLAAETARVGVETADLFPRVTFIGTVGLQANTLAGLGASGADTYAFGPRISWAAFDLGRVRQRIKAAGARAEAALAAYEQTVLLALEETENSLVALARERERLFHLHEAERAAAEASDLARQRYRDGIADYLSVLDAERTLLSLQEQLVATRTLSATRLVSVYKAFAP